MATERGFGIRVPESTFAAATETLLGESAMQLDGKIYEVDGIPFSWSAENLEESAANVWNWVISCVRPRRRGRTRTWYVRAQEEPPHEFYQLDEGLAVIRLAGNRPAAPPATRQRWVPGGNLQSDVKWPELWTDPTQKPSLREKAAQKAKSPAFGGRMSTSPSLPPPAPAAAAASDMAAIIREAVAAAMAPHTAALEALREDVMDLQDFEDEPMERASATGKRPGSPATSGRSTRRPRGGA